MSEVKKCPRCGAALAASPEVRVCVNCGRAHAVLCVENGKWYDVIDKYHRV